MKEIMQEYGKIGGFIIGTTLKGIKWTGPGIAGSVLAMGLSAAKFAVFFALTSVSAIFLAWTPESRKALGALCASSVAEVPRFLAAFSATIANLSGAIDYFRGFCISKSDLATPNSNVVHPSPQDGVHTDAIALKKMHEKERDKVERMFAGAFATVFFVNAKKLGTSDTAWVKMQKSLVAGETGKKTYKAINSTYTALVRKIVNQALL